MTEQLSKLQRLPWIGVPALCCVIVDQLTKSIAKGHLRYAELNSYLGDTLRLQLAHNRGAFLSLGDSLPDAIRQPLFSVGVGIMLAAILLFAFFTKSLNRMTLVALALIFAGGASNLGDRLAYGGYVVDFLNIGIGSLRTGIFNVADMAIMAGGALILIDAFRKPSTDKSG